jgi:phosphoribosylglycinamide formyltransferase-1
MPGNIVVLISGTGSNMVALMDACEADRVPGDVVAAVADRECEGIAIARRRGVATHVCPPGDFADRHSWSSALADAVRAYEPELVVSAGFMRILAPVFVDAFAGRLINLHPSLLPKFPGAHAVRDALLEGESVTGTTVHLVDHLVDHGTILAQRQVPIDPADDEGSLHRKIKLVEHDLLPEVCAAMLQGRSRPGP